MCSHAGGGLGGYGLARLNCPRLMPWKRRARAEDLPGESCEVCGVSVSIDAGSAGIIWGSTRALPPLSSSVWLSFVELMNIEGVTETCLVQSAKIEMLTHGVLQSAFLE